MAPSISKMLVRARLGRKMKQENLGPLVGCSRSYISKLENGETFPSLELTERLEKALQIRDGHIVKAVTLLKQKEKKLKEITKKSIRQLRARFDGAA